jgi:hypothetical protein
MFMQFAQQKKPLIKEEEKMKVASVILSFAFSLVCVSCGPSAGQSPANSSQDNKPAASAEKPETVVRAGPRDVKVGAFTVKVPAEWSGFSPGDAAALQQQFQTQSEQIYRQYAGKDDPASSVDIAAFHLAGEDGAFIVVSLTVPPQANLMNVLKSQAKDKADWGVQQGIIRKYLGLVPIDNEQFSGFYVRNIGKDGDYEVSGGLENKKLRNTLIQLTLLCPQSWDQDKADKTLQSLLSSLTLAK